MYVILCMYVCVCVCVTVCEEEICMALYACMHVCMHACMHACVYVYMSRGGMYVCMYVCQSDIVSLYMKSRYVRYNVPCMYVYSVSHQPIENLIIWRRLFQNRHDLPQNLLPKFAAATCMEFLHQLKLIFFKFFM
jgi:hypothetical protein